MHSQKEHLVGWHKACWDWARGCNDLSLHVDSQECHCSGSDSVCPMTRSVRFLKMIFNVPFKVACPKQFVDVCSGKN